MRHLTYLALLAGCLIATAPLEFLLGLGVYRRWRRWVLAITPAVAVGVGWDAYAVRHGQWNFNARYVVNLRVGGLPIEELLFFLVIPVCAILTFEAVRRVRPRWLAGQPHPTGARSLVRPRIRSRP